jgi:hypothetical protein
MSHKYCSRVHGKDGTDTVFNLSKESVTPRLAFLPAHATYGRGIQRVNQMKIKPLIFLTIAVLFSTLLNRAATARPLEQYEQEVNNQLQHAIKTAKDEGYQLSFPPNVAKLARKAEAPKTVMLYPNREYSFVAVCDRNCDQLRLAIKDKDGKSLMVTPTADPVAVVTFKPPSEDRYQITVKMEKCSLQSCYFGLGIFAKR